jgi:ribosomal-protein-alanine N-acetyltransferase
MRVSRFQSIDMPRVLEIEQACFPEEAYPEELFAEYARKSPELFLVARCGGRVVGYGIAVVRGRSAELISIAVDPQHRRRRVGQALLDAALRGISRAGGDTCRLAVRATNAEAICFYERSGFERVKLIQGYYGDGGDAIAMKRALARSG